MIARLGRRPRRALRTRAQPNGRAWCSVTALVLLLAGTAHAQILSRLPIERVIASLHAPDAHTRVEAAGALAVTGPTVRVVPELAVVLAGEAVPEVRAALITALARRADASAAAPLIGAWGRASPEERGLVLDGLAAIETSEALTFVAEQLESELLRPGACARLARTEAGLAIVMTNLGVAERRDGAALCLAQLVARERAAAALSSVLATLRPASLAVALEALDGDPRAIEPAVAALAAGDPLVVPSALALLARHAPERVPVERWRALATEAGPSQPSAILALTSRDPAAGEAAIASVVASGGAGRAAVLDALASDADDARWLTSFVAIEGTRARALDALVRVTGGPAVLAELPAASDVTLALALAAAHDREALGPLRERVASLEPAARLFFLAVAGAISAGACTLEGEPTVEHRRTIAFCLSRTSDGGETATQLLESERDATVVSWLALATHEPPHGPALEELLAADTTRLAVLHLVPRAMQRATPSDARRLRRVLVHAARASRGGERAEAIRALAALADPRHRALVALALDDEAAPVRIAALHALARLSTEPVSEIRRVGRARIEHDDDVRAALDEPVPALADAPLLVRVDVRGEGAAPSEVEVALADGRTLVLAPVQGEIVLFGVPARPAHVRLVDPERD